MPSNKELISQIEELLDELSCNPEDISISETAKQIFGIIRTLANILKEKNNESKSDNR